MKNINLNDRGMPIMFIASSSNTLSAAKSFFSWMRFSYVNKDITVFETTNRNLSSSRNLYIHMRMSFIQNEGTVILLI